MGTISGSRVPEIALDRQLLLEQWSRIILAFQRGSNSDTLTTVTKTLPFKSRVERALSDPQLQSSLASTASKFHFARERAWAELNDIESLRHHAKRVRRHTLDHLDSYLEQLADQIRLRGGVVHFAGDAREAQHIIRDLVRHAGGTRVVKSKSMTSEEIALNEALDAVGVDAVETDLGEWIVQLAGESPSHIIAPAIHKSRAEVAQLIGRHVGQDLTDAGIPELTKVARESLRAEFLRARVGISGVNFAVAENGSLVLVTNEGNGRFVTSLPTTHIAVMGMEKVIPTLADLAVMLELLPRSATGQSITSYVQLLSGPRRRNELDGPTDLHLVIIDNGRSRLLEGEFAESLQCIRCGACLNGCPVYRAIGGHAYGSVYSGPIGAVQASALTGEDDRLDLPMASTLCGACRDVCPVAIDIPRMLLAHRQNRSAGLKKADHRREFLPLVAFGRLSLRPGLFRLSARISARLQPRLKPAQLSKVNLLGGWLRHRDAPTLARESFHLRAVRAGLPETSAAVQAGSEGGSDHGRSEAGR